MTTRNRRLLWAASVIVAFILGYLLGRSGQKCPSGNMGTGHHVPNGATGSLSGEGDVERGRSREASVSATPPQDPAGPDPLHLELVDELRLPNGRLGGKSANDQQVGPKMDMVTAPNFQYDLTGLPRYSNVTRAMSGLSTRKDIPADTGTVAAMLTQDSFDSVASWYHTHVPPGWHETKMGNMEQTAAQLSTQSIGKMLSAYVNGAPASDSSAAPTDSVPGHSVATWTAPDNDAHRFRGIMVTSAPGEPTRVVMKRSVSQ